MLRSVRALSGLAATGALVVAGLAAVPGASAAPQRRVFARTAPTWVARAQSLGPARPTSKVDIRVYLAPRGGMAGLQTAVAGVSDPRSASYRHFLTAAQYHRRYDATGVAVARVSRFLRANHLHVTAVESHHRYLAVSGSAASVERAFLVSLERFRHRGRVVRANTRPVSLPMSVGRFVTTVTGLDTTPHRVTPGSIAPPAGFRNARPCSRFYGQLDATYKADYRTKLPKFGGKTLPYSVCGYTGPVVRAAYEGNSTLSGSGVTVAVIDAYAAPTIAKDANTYATRNGDGSYAPGQLTQVAPSTFTHEKECDASGWFGEETLDVEAVHAMAVSSRIRYYAAKSCEDADLLDTQTKVVDQNKASIVTNSYGEAEADSTAALVAASQQVFMQGALQGISFMFSSGDDGDELANTGVKQADSSGDSPYVTAVGGTSDAIGPDGAFSFQTGWGTEKAALSPDGKSWVPMGFLYGSGGGDSSQFNKPAYQKGVVPSRLASGRGVPDVGLDGDPNTGFLIGETQAFSDGTYYDQYRIGGTSLSSPLFAGMTALLSQHAGGRLGLLNPLIYSQAGTSVFTDIKGTPKDAGNVRVDYANSEDTKDGLLYSVRTFDQDSSLVTVKGWDNVTGVGSPNAKWLTSVK